MVWWAVALPFEGISLLYTRTFFSLQRTWITTPLALTNIGLNAIVALALHEPFGISGIVIGTVVGTASMTALQAAILRRDLGSIEGRATALAFGRMLLAGLALGATSYAVWRGLDAALGRALWAQIVSLGTAIAAGGATYAACVLGLRVREAHEIWGLVKGRVRRG
jgi:putative peptidoglycan lipid II flippase